MIKAVLKIIAWLMMLLLVLSVSFIFIYWVPDRSLDELKPRWAQAPSAFVELAGMQVHLRDEGPRDDPIPILLLHGTSASLHTWEAWVQLLKNEHRLIRLDLPGFGLTGPAPDNEYSIEKYAQLLIVLLDYLQVDQVILVGNSLGGNVAWNTAFIYPNRVHKLVLIDSSGYPFQAQSIPIGFKIATIPVLNKIMQKVLPRAVVESSVKNVYGNPALVTSDLVDRYFELTTRAGNRQALADRLKQIRAGQNLERLSELKQPTLIIWGDKDRLIPVEIGERFHQAIPNSEFVNFEELGHVPQEEDPIKTVSAFKQFLSKVEQASN